MINGWVGISFGVAGPVTVSELGSGEVLGGSPDAGRLGPARSNVPIPKPDSASLAWILRGEGDTHIRTEGQGASPLSTTTNPYQGPSPLLPLHQRGAPNHTWDSQPGGSGWSHT